MIKMFILPSWELKGQMVIQLHLCKMVLLECFLTVSSPNEQAKLLVLMIPIVIQIMDSQDTWPGRARLSFYRHLWKRFRLEAKSDFYYCVKDSMFQKISRNKLGNPNISSNLLVSPT